MVEVLLRVALFFSLLNHKSPVTVTTCTVMVWVRTARKTCAVTAHLSFICGWPKPPRKYRGMRFPWPHGKLFRWMHKVQTALQIYNTIFYPLADIYTTHQYIFYPGIHLDIELESPSFSVFLGSHT